MNPRRVLAALTVVLLTLPLSAAARPLVIAHRGASGYLPEHTLEAYAYAHSLGSDFVEQDLVLSKDDVLVVCHDIHIDTTTEVAARFPDRKRPDGRFYALDFTWAELKSLPMRERFDEKTGLPVFPRRFPANGASFRLCSMEEAILLVQGLNRATGRTVGLYPEIKNPAWHAQAGKDPGRALLALLARHGYTKPADNVFVQSFDPAELKRLRFELKTELRLVQLLGDNAWGESAADYTAMQTPAGLKEIATYAQGLGPHLGQIATGAGPDDRPQFTALVRDAHAVGLLVHPYTFRADALPKGVPAINALYEVFIRGAQVDGVFTDQPDTAVRYLSRAAAP